MKRTIVVTVLVVLGTIGIAVGWHRFASAAVPAGAEQIVQMTAKKFEYNPSQITLKKGGQVTRVRIVPDRIGTFEFRCDVFCGDHHEDMAGEIVVVD
jgi:hypothetical protein